MRRGVPRIWFAFGGPEYDFAFAMLGFGELSLIFPAMPDGLAIVKRFDRITAADDAAFLDPTIEA
jgi:hypothetical protein